MEANQYVLDEAQELGELIDDMDLVVSMPATPEIFHRVPNRADKRAASRQSRKKKKGDRRG